MTLEQIMAKDKAIEKVLLEPSVLDSLYLSREIVIGRFKEYEHIPEYASLCNESVEDLDKIIFLIKQLKEGYLK